MRLRLTWLGGVVLAGCASGGFPAVIEQREVPSAFGAPRIARVRDAGAVRIPVGGPWRGEEDGVATPGEVVLIEGDNLGKQPTITIGGRATAILGRTDGGGVLARVPAGVPAGEQVDVSVSSPKGRASKPLRVRRLAVVVHAGQVWALGVGRDGAQVVGQPLSVPGARAVRLSSDGAAAYVLGGDGDRIVVIDLAAAGGPKVRGERKLTHKAQLLASAQDAPVLAAVGDGQITLFSTGDQVRPAPWDAVALPKEARQLRSAELSPDGKVLALLPADGNKLVVCDVEKPPLVKLVTTVDLLPDQRLALVRDLAFSSDGETLWVVSGDNARTLPAVQPTRLTAVRLMVGAPADAPENAPPPPPGTPRPSGARLLSVWRTQSVPGAAAPLKLAIARGQPLASGTTIRMPPEKAAVFVTSVTNAMFKLAPLPLETQEGVKEALKLWNPPRPGIMVRGDINGGGGPLFSTSQLLSAVDLTPDATLVVATSARLSPGPNDAVRSYDFGVTVAPVWGGAEPTFLQLGALTPNELKPPFEIGDVRIQP